jgi:hypothetical protein
MPLAWLLLRDDRFREIYRDDIASVFVAKRRVTTPALPR